jgi:hypothetical protein
MPNLFGMSLDKNNVAISLSSSEINVPEIC